MVHPTEMPQGFINKSTSFLDYLAPCIMRHHTWGEAPLPIINKDIYHLPCEILLYFHQGLENNIEEVKIQKETYPPLHYIIEEKNLSHRDIMTISPQNTPVSAAIPSTITIGEIKGNYYKQLAYSHINNFTAKDIVTPSFTKNRDGLDPFALGNLHHTIMENLDLNIHNKDNLLEFIQGLILKNIISKEEEESININKLYSFLNSPLAARMKKSKVKKETPFTMYLTPREAYIHAPEEEGPLVVHGIIDAYFEEDGEIILVDYKTDNISHNIQAVVEERYFIQMSVYKRALEKITGKKVKECIVYLIFGEEEVLLRLKEEGEPH